MLPSLGLLFWLVPITFPGHFGSGSPLSITHSVTTFTG